MVTSEEQTILKGLTNAIHSLNETEWQDFSAVLTRIQAGRKEVLTSIGEAEKYLYVVLEGVQRVYYLDDHDREATLVFSYPPSFGGVLDAFLLQQPSRYFYETLSPSVFLRASYTDIEQLMKQHRGVEALIRKGVTMATSGILERLVELQCFSSEERFRQLLKRSPHILQWVPHKYLANYLGMDATNFSKLMNRVKI
jgi:CRP-like cAMP-binding protein